LETAEIILQSTIDGGIVMGHW